MNNACPRTEAPVQSRTLIRLCKIEDIPEGSALQVTLPEHAPLAVFRIAGECFVTDDTCTHGNASLSEGDIEDGLVICPFHSGSFDIRTGEPVDRPCTKKLQTYEAIADEGVLYTALPMHE
ncbi:MAG: non-heme iron oxygenase ferredoxin subunit [Thauera sp.]|nr:non-heme iron oxygenase ferredoxin subunit [Thauera sp.]